MYYIFFAFFAHFACFIWRFTFQNEINVKVQKTSSTLGDSKEEIPWNSSSVICLQEGAWRVLGPWT